MGRFVYWMNTSLDLFIESDAAAPEEGGGDWLRITESLHRHFNERARALALDVNGRIVYEIMERYWPAARTDESSSEVEREYGRIWVEKPKVLVSNTRTSAGYNTRVIGGADAMEQLARIREEVEGDIGVGGATLATGLLHAGLLDELLLYVHPVILGRGRPLFDDDLERIELDPLETQAFEAGVVMHRYAVRGARPLRSR